ncbi:hypothetical protein J5Y09_24050 [Roseomonas sp. PWR1]|uniref:ATPase n=1 Tax=Roseomonas nitratireducens TaxID=2820810 RepID=A0ABS4B0B9_9PROT|nr:hypothetical protein [Neoroseomonas nitratireducens]MBP0467017.1 hypothetical protein [Neoroseomonas nitratireducens]
MSGVTAREKALMQALVDHVQEATGAVSAAASARLTEIEQVVIAARDAQHDAEERAEALASEVAALRDELALARSQARQPVEQAASLVKAARRTIADAEDAIAIQRRWARDYLMAKARGLAA